MGNRLRQEYGEIETIRLNESKPPVTLRQVEVDAVDHMVNGKSPRLMDEDEFAEAMLKQGMVRCNRCQHFRHFSEFSADMRNTGRLCCASYCKECTAAMRRRKNAAVKPLPADLPPYEYHPRKKKRKRALRQQADCHRR